MMGMRTAEREDEATGGRVPDAAPALHGQAAEKALKALLTSRDRTFTKTHDIGAIGRAAIETDPDLHELVADAAILTEYAWLYRCPGDATEPPKDEVRDALLTARALVEAVERRA